MYDQTVASTSHSPTQWHKRKASMTYYYRSEGNRIGQGELSRCRELLDRPGTFAASCISSLLFRLVVRSAVLHLPRSRPQIESGFAKNVASGVLQFVTVGHVVYWKTEMLSLVTSTTILSAEILESCGNSIEDCSDFRQRGLIPRQRTLVSSPLRSGACPQLFSSSAYSLPLPLESAPQPAHQLATLQNLLGYHG